MDTTKRSEKAVLAAIRDSRGIKIVIARKLKVHRGSVDNYLRRYPRAQQAYEEETEIIGDIAESVLIKAIQKNDVDVAKWYCRMKLRSRGYVDHTELGGEQGGPIVLKVIYENARPADEGHDDA